MIYISVFCVILIIFGSGFWLGRQKGKAEGIDEGILFSPLEMRRQCLEDGWCHICGHRVRKGRKLTRHHEQDRIEQGQKLTSGGNNGAS